MCNFVIQEKIYKNKKCLKYVINLAKLKNFYIFTRINRAINSIIWIF